MAIKPLSEDGDNRYIYRPGGLPIEQVAANGKAVFFHQDQLGSTRVLSDAHGHAAAALSYDPYGAMDSGFGATPLGFAAQYTDLEEGRHAECD